MRSKSLKILVVEDDPDYFFILKEIIKRNKNLNISLSHETTLNSSLERIKKDMFDAILLDLNLSDSKGLVSIEKLNKVVKNTPIIVLTGESEESIGLNSLKMGVQDFIQKNYLEPKSFFRSLIFSIERFQLRNELRKTKKRFETIISESLDGVIIIDKSNIINFVNPAVEKLLQKSRKELIGSTIDFPLNVDKTIEFEWKLNNHSKIILELCTVNTIWDDKNVFLTTIRDITYRRKIEIELRVSEERLNFATEGSNSGVWDADLINQRTFFSTEWKKMLGYEDDEISDDPNEWNNRLHPEDVNRVNRILEKHFRGKKPSYTAEYRILCKDGSYKWILAKGKVVERDLNNNPIRFVGIQIDISNQKDLEEQLILSQISLDHSKDAIFRIDKKGNFVYVNEAACKSLEYSRSELLSKSLSDIDPQFSRKKYLKLIDNLKREKSSIFLSKHKTKNGRVFDVELDFDLIKYENTEFIFAFARNITEKKQMQERLKRNEAQYRVLFEDSPQPLFLLDYSLINEEFSLMKQNQISNIKKYFQENPSVFSDLFSKLTVLDLNNAALDLFNYSNKKKLIVNITSVLKDTKYIKNVFCSIFNGANVGSYETNGITSTGDHLDLIMSFKTISEIETSMNQIIISLQDITNIKKTETALRTSEDRLRIALDANNVGIFEFSTVPEEIYVSRDFAKVWGYELDELPSPKNLLDWWEKRIHPEDKKKTISKISDFLEAKIPNPSPLVFRSQHKNGSWIYVEARVKKRENDSKGNIKSILGTVLDVTEQKIAEESLSKVKDHLLIEVKKQTRDLSEQNQKIKTIIESIPDGILVLDSNDLVSLANQTFRNIYFNVNKVEFNDSYSLDKIPQNSFFQEILNIKSGIGMMSKTIEPKIGLHMQLQSAPIILPKENSSIGTIIQIRDVSNFIEFESLRKQFVSIVSHELRTPITVITQSVSNLNKYNQKLSNERKEKLMSGITRNATLMAELVEDLLFISRIDERKITIDWKPYNLDFVLNDVLNQLDPKRISKKIKIVLNVEDDIQLFGDAKRIGQIFRILVDNAIKYSPEGSEILVYTEKSYKGKYNPKKIEGLLIQVQDKGLGIKKEDLKFLFQRFYRADDAKNVPGTGLGLSIAKDLALLHSGNIFVETEYKIGSTFKVFLPYLDDSVIL